MEQAQQLADDMDQDAASVLAETLELLWPTFGDVPDVKSDVPASQLSDDEVLALADLKMNLEQNERLGYLQAKGKNTTLTADERYELLALMHIYQRGQLRKSQGLVEAVRRKLRPPLS
ncbi:hypothetical protein GC175_09720 [bacterium]|nr:hypothetical protein [bacterium]